MLGDSRFVWALIAVIGINLGFFNSVVFLCEQWGAWGFLCGLSILPPLLICPIWEWMSTGNFITFIFVYVVGFAGLYFSRPVNQ